MKPATKILQKVRRGVQNVAYGNPIYRKMLASGEAPGRLHFTLPDLWPGDAQAGLALIGSQRSLFDRPSLPHPGTVLRNLRAVGTDAARQAALNIIENWLDHYEQWDDVEWEPEVIGSRIAGWIGAYEFYAPAASPDFIARLTASLQQQYKHLMRTMTSALADVGGLCALKGLVLGGLNFEDGEKALGVACDLLKRQLAAEILPDGGSISRNPATQLHMVRHLIDLRAAFKASGIEAPDPIRTTVGIMVPALRLYRHGDGGLALFHGGSEETALLIDAVIAQAGTKSRILRRLPDTGYERLTAGRSLLIADCGRPPPRGHDKNAHAGLLSFELSHGRERLFVNCGNVEGSSSEWRIACAATAAHSTISIEDTNAAEVMESGGIVCTARVTAHRYEQDGQHCVEMTHDAYRAEFGITHQRFLGLSADGDELRGRDVLIGNPGRAFALRWHLHPSVQASLTQSGQTALLRMPSGIGWRMHVEGFDLALEPSVYCGSGSPRRSLHLKVSGHTGLPSPKRSSGFAQAGGTETSLVWSLTREKKG
jgi:uncharacterized heparinase superfamily protein